MKNVFKRNDTKCPYCSGNENSFVKERRPGQNIVLCTMEECGKYYMIQNALVSFPLLDPNDLNSAPGNMTKI